MKKLFKVINPQLSTLTIHMLMKQNVFDEAFVYEAPEMFSSEVSVENGFAASPFERATIDIDNFEDGVEF